MTFDYRTAESRKARRAELKAARDAHLVEVVETETVYGRFVIRHTTDPFVDYPVEIETLGLPWTETFASVEDAQSFIDRLGS